MLKLRYIVSQWLYIMQFARVATVGYNIMAHAKLTIMGEIMGKSLTIIHPNRHLLIFTILCVPCTAWT